MTMFDSLAASFERRRARQRPTTHSADAPRPGAVTGGQVLRLPRTQRDGTGYVYRVIDEAEAAVVRQIFTLYAEGAA